MTLSDKVLLSICPQGRHSGTKQGIKVTVEEMAVTKMEVVKTSPAFEADFTLFISS